MCDKQETGHHRGWTDPFLIYGFHSAWNSLPVQGNSGFPLTKRSHISPKWHMGIFSQVTRYTECISCYQENHLTSYAPSLCRNYYPCPLQPGPLYSFLGL